MSQKLCNVNPTSSIPWEHNHDSHTPKRQLQNSCFLQSRPGLRADKPMNNGSLLKLRWQKSSKFNLVNNCSIWGWTLVCPRCQHQLKCCNLGFFMRINLTSLALQQSPHFPAILFYFPLPLCHWRH